MDSNRPGSKDSLRMIEWTAESEEDARPAQARASLQAFRERRKRPRLNPSLTALVSEELRAIPFVNASATPLPEAVESSTEFAWLEFDAAQVQIDLSTEAGRKEYAALRGVRLTGTNWPAFQATASGEF